MSTLSGKVALVTGGSRNVGRGISLGLGEAGATVYITGRTVMRKVATEVGERGGKGIAVRCDHRNDDEVKSVFEQIREKEGSLDILVNNAWGGYERIRKRKKYKGYKWNDPFWKQPLEVWDEMQTVGLRSNYIASALAVPMMIKQGSGLIVSISFFAGRQYNPNIVYGVVKAGVDRLALDMSVQLKPHNVASVSLYPGHVTNKISPVKNSETSQFVGRAVAALASDPEIMNKSGEILITRTLAREYGFTDIDGTLPALIDLPTYAASEEE